MIAAPRLALRYHIERGDTMINVVGDSEMVYKFMTEGTKKFGKGDTTHLRPLFDELDTAWRAVQSFVTVCRMNRVHGNPADKVASNTILTASSTGDDDIQELFITPTILPPREKVTHRNHAEPMHLPCPSDVATVPETLEQYASMHRYSTRSTVPSSSVWLWSTLVRHHFKRFLDAPAEERETELKRIIMLPTYYLPVRASTNRISKHLQRGEPFQVELSAERRERQHRSEHRLSEAITRLLIDYKVRSAGRLLSGAADTPDIPHEAKVTQIEKKLLDGDFTSSITHERVPSFSPQEVEQALTSCNKQAANAIDGWTAQLLMQAAEVNNEIYTMIADTLHWILTTPMSDLMRDMLVMSRGVGIPKDDGVSVRPLCVSSIFVKLLGTLCSDRDQTKTSTMQYAIGPKDGAKRIIHKVRSYIATKGTTRAAVLRFDISNAYGTMGRKILEDILKHADASLRQYFRLIYGNKSTVAVFGPQGVTLLPLGEGVKQGDATSSLFFCLGVDTPLGKISAYLQEHNIDAEVYMYMDDLTICVETDHANGVAQATIDAFHSIGLMINEAKSKILTDAVGSFILPRCSHAEEFIVLGVNLAEGESAKRAFTERLLRRQQDYFALFKKVSLHPQAVTTLLRVCGHPRITYFCATVPPPDMVDVAHYFDSKVKEMVELIIDPQGTTRIPEATLHDDLGFGAPCYRRNLEDMYHAYALASETNAISAVSVCVTTRNLSSSLTKAQADSQWLFYDHHNSMSEHQFRMALAIRLGVLPAGFQLQGSKCNCGNYVYDEDARETVDHILACDSSTPAGHTLRHNMVRDTIIHTARMYGITTTKEPTCFTYGDGHARRPDALFHTQPLGLATDVSMTSRYPCDEHIQRIEKEKINHHTTPVEANGCLFRPFVMATRGTLGKRAEELIRTLAGALMPFERRYFVRQLHHAVSTAAARGRADAVSLAVRRHRAW